MNILFLALYPPDPPLDGGRLRMYNTLKQAALRHRVTLVCFADPLSRPEHLDHLREMCERVVVVSRPELQRRRLADKLNDLLRRRPAGLRQWESPAMGATLRELVASCDLSLAHVDHLSLAQYLELLCPMTVVLTHHNVEGMAQRRFNLLAARGTHWQHLAQIIETRRWIDFEILASRAVSALIVVSEADAKYFRRHVPAVPSHVVPNGVDTEYFAPVTGEHRHLLFTASMNYAPNVDAMRWFCTRIFPTIRRAKPQAELFIVGRDPTPEVLALRGVGGVTVTGTVDDVRPYFGRAAVFVAPLRLGGGTRLKILEAMAMGVPVVSTTIGCEGLDVVPDLDLLTADDPDTFPRQVLRLMDDPILSCALSQHAHRTVAQRYAWQVIGDELNRVYLAHGGIASKR